MPAYDYRCIECDEVFEVRHAAGERPDVCCTSCGAGSAKRVFTPVGVHFKGSGFHNTDYRPKPAEPTSSDAPSCPNKETGSSACASCPAAD